MAIARSSWICLGCLLLCFAALACCETSPGAQASASASSSAMAKGDGATANAKAEAEAKAKAETKGQAEAKAQADAKATAGTAPSDGKKPEPEEGKQVINPDALKAWRDYSTQCAGKNYDPKKTQSGTCANLSGALCSRKDVKCGANKTDFLDAAGAVIGSGEDDSGKLS